MYTVLRAPLFLALLGGPLLAHAEPPATGVLPTSRIAARLTERLGLDAEAGAAVAEILATGHEQARLLRSSVHDQAEVLRAALEGGDVAAMESSMAELQRLQAEISALQQVTTGEVMAWMSPEQRAAWTLGRLRRSPQERSGQHAGTPQPTEDLPLALPFEGL